MQDIILGILAMLAGAFFCFHGHAVLRLVISVWAAFVGFNLGAGLVARISGDRFLGSLVDWMVAIVLAAVFAACAYAYFAAAVVLALASVGFALSAALLVALGVEWNWWVVLIAVAVGVLLAVLAIVSNLPMLLLVVLGAVSGASVVVAGAMLLAGALQSADFTNAGVAEGVRSGLWWYAVLVVLATAGVAYQLRDTRALRRSVRDVWTNRAHT
jgi:hypothetical protein